MTAGPFALPGGWRFERAASVAAPALILMAPLVTYLRFHGFDLLAAEASLCLAGFAALGLLIGLSCEIRPAILRPVVLMAMTLPWTLAPAASGVYSAVEWIAVWMNVNPEQSTIPVRVASGAVGLLGLWQLILYWLMRRHIGLIVATVFGVMLAVAAAGSSGTEPQVVRAAAPPPLRADLPPVVHLVLDEHIGVAGIPEDIPGGRELKRDIVAFYERHGFRLYPNAFSHYWNTEESLSNLVNGTVSPMMQANIKIDGMFVLAHNRWFDALRGTGYRIQVVQTDYLRFCTGGDVEACRTYPPNSVGSLRDESSVAPTTTIKAILQTYLENPLRYRTLGPFYENRVRPAASTLGIELPEWNWGSINFGPIASKKALAEMFGAIKRRPEGTVFFAHFMLTHNAYLLAADCNPDKDFLNWMFRNDFIQHPMASNTSAGRARRYMRYFEQLRCTYRLLDDLFAEMRASGSIDNATIFVHGDHGSRIAMRDPTVHLAALLSARDIVDGYSTLYAVRMPGLAPSLSLETRSIQSLFAEHALGESDRNESRHVFVLPKVRRPLTPLFAHNKPFDLELKSDGGQSAAAVAAPVVRGDPRP
ncbi:MAG TPA: hypothetical protein VLG66_00190 [Alphaproteobacteria bacterium]|nr:hypothetical protein [Alphaproteobacteria bacterium]